MTDRKFWLTLFGILLLGFVMCYSYYGNDLFNTYKFRDKAFHVLHADAMDGEVSNQSYSDWFRAREDYVIGIKAYPVFTAAVIHTISDLFNVSVTQAFNIVLLSSVFIILPLALLWLLYEVTNDLPVSLACTFLFVVGSWAQRYFLLGVLPQTLVTIIALLFLIYVRRKKWHMLPVWALLMGVIHRYGLLLALCMTVLTVLFNHKKKGSRGWLLACFAVLFLSYTLTPVVSVGAITERVVADSRNFGMALMGLFWSIRNTGGLLLFLGILILGIVGLFLFAMSRRDLDLVLLCLLSFYSWWVDSYDRSMMLASILWFVLVAEALMFLRGVMRRREDKDDDMSGAAPKLRGNGVDDAAEGCAIAVKN